MGQRRMTLRSFQDFDIDGVDDFDSSRSFFECINLSEITTAGKLDADSQDGR